jgi:GNAT superfamily N-acetyltransferase
MIFILEQASEADFAGLFELRILAMRESLERIGRFDRQRAYDRFRGSFRPEHTRLITIDGSLAGCVALGASGDGLLLEHFYIAPERQGRGLGQAVLRQVLQEADKAALPVRLSVLQRSDAGRFYARHGFSVVGQDEWDVYYERRPQGIAT